MEMLLKKEIGTPKAMPAPPELDTNVKTLSYEDS